MQTTKRGMELALQLARYFTKAQLGQIAGLCSLIARHARTHNRLQEVACSVEMSEAQQARHDKRDAAIEDRISALVSQFPRSKRGRILVRFEGDPRGYTVKLVVPKAKRDGNTWGLEGLYGV